LVYQRTLIGVKQHMALLALDEPLSSRPPLDVQQVVVALSLVFSCKGVTCCYAAFDVKLEEATGRIIALEGAAKHNDYMAAHNNTSADAYAITYYAPVINIARTPTWGRIQESYGESVFLSQQLGSAYVQGIQASSGPVPPYNNTYQLGSAMAKHFVA
jgi:hypothetical protein